jgi:hypothetical protein
MSLGNSVLLGITSLVGALGLPILRNMGSLGEILPAGDSFTDMLATTAGRIVLLGILVLMVGIVLCGKAGLMKDKELANIKEGVNSEFKLRTGLIIAVISIIVIANLNKNKTENSESSISSTVVVLPQPQNISSNVLFTGNIFWGRYVNDWSMASDLKYAYPFSRLDEFDREQYDAWVSGLECPVVAGVNISSADMDKTLTFNCSPDYLPEASKYFNILTLANNHTDNQGYEGFEETKQHLEENGIQYFGHYDYKATDDVCEIISLIGIILI